jgi:hypothetical protein
VQGIDGGGQAQGIRGRRRGHGDGLRVREWFPTMTGC